MDDLLHALTQPETIVALIIGVLIGIVPTIALSGFRALRRQHLDRRDIRREMREEREEEEREWRFMFLIEAAIQGYDYQEANAHWGRMSRPERGHWVIEYIRQYDEPGQRHSSRGRSKPKKTFRERLDEVTFARFPDEFLHDLFSSMIPREEVGVFDATKEHMYQDGIRQLVRDERSGKRLPAVIDRVYEERWARLMFLWQAVADGHNYRQAVEQWSRMNTHERRPWIAKFRSEEGGKVFSSISDDDMLHFPDDLLQEFVGCNPEAFDGPAEVDEFWRWLREQRIQKGLPPVIE